MCPLCVFCNKKSGKSGMKMKDWMDAPHYTTTAFRPIDDWLDEEIVGFEPEEG
jgi:hypothetical protein